MFAAVFYRIGWLLIFLAVGMVSPAVFAFVDGTSGQFVYFFGSILGTAFCGVGLILSLRDYRGNESTGVAALFVVTAWVVTPLFGALPLYLSETFPTYTDAWFEAVSALTTTGATLITPESRVGPEIYVWRAIMQWLGGLGTLVMASVVLTTFNWRGVPLANVPMPGRRRQGLLGRMPATLNLIWPVYAVLTFGVFCFIAANDVPVFDALCLSLSTVSTGGMMPGPGGLALYQAPWLGWVLCLAMALCGLNVMLHWYGSRGRWMAYLADVEARHYVMFVGLAIAVSLVTLAVVGVRDPERGILPARSEDFAEVVFLAVSLVTTTGFYQDLRGAASALPAPLILALVSIGGCALSTAGGLKVIRIVLLMKHANRELARLGHPNGVARVRYGGVTVKERVLFKVGAMAVAVLVVFSLFSVLLSAVSVPLNHASAASIAALSNAGPAFILATRLEAGFAALPPEARPILSLAMIVGRVEILMVLGLLSPAYWRHA